VEEVTRVACGTAYGGHFGAYVGRILFNNSQEQHHGEPEPDNWNKKRIKQVKGDFTTGEMPECSTYQMKIIQLEVIVCNHQVIMSTWFQ
jgi:hypothetical protein